LLTPGLFLRPPWRNEIRGFLAMFERRLYHHVDWAMVGAILALCLIGLAQIYSATYNQQSGVSSIFYTQIWAIFLGFVALLVALSIDYRSLADKSHFLYIAILALLIGVLVFGVVRGGSRRWIDLGPMNLQPSEFAKATLALVLAKFFGESRRGAVTRADLLIAAAITAVPLLLIARQPDLGTAVTLVPVLFAAAYVAGMPMRIFGILAVAALLAAPVAWKFALKDYQKERISTFFDPSQDARGAGYQQIQARITVGSGGPFGKGFQGGTQGQLRFLPEAQNDFIFSVLAEEHGFMGVVVALGLYLFVILRSLEAARLAKDRLGAYLVLGVLATFTFQVVYNITMSAGLAPVKGLTLPLMSYGGSSMIATLAGFGLILNVRMRRFTN
jgi:rod shape determining protein RodA